MKKLIVIAMAMMMGVAAAHAAIEVELDAGPGYGGVPSVTMTFSNLAEIVTIESGVLSNETVLIDSEVTGASGSFSVTWTATDVAGPLDASTWTFGTNANVYSWFRGFGIQSGLATTPETDGFLQYQPGEAFLLTFNTNNLSLDPGKVLIFSLKTYKDGTSFSVYQRIGETNGAVIAAYPGATPTAYSPFAQVVPSSIENGTLQFAVTGFSAYDVMTHFKIDVIDQLNGPDTVGGLKAISRDAGVLLDWTDDPTGYLDYYTVYRSFTTPVVANAYWSTNVTASTFTDTGLANGTAYYYAVIAMGTNGVPSPESSAEVSATPQALDTNTVLLMHYDASDVASVQTDPSGAVTNWLNQVGGGASYPAFSTTYPSPLYPSTDLSDSGIAGLDCTTNATELQLMSAAQTDVLLDMTGTNSGFVVMMAIRPATLKTNFNSQYILSNSSGPAAGGFGIRQKNNGIETWLGASAGTMSSTPATGVTVVVSVRYDVEDLTLSAWESASGNTLSVSRDPEDYSSLYWLKLGDFSHSDFDFEGQIFEVKIWGSTLDDAALAAEQSAMITKWVGGTGYDTWAGLWTDDIGEATDDPDGDGLNNLYEYGLDGNPTNADDKGTLPTFSRVGGGFEYIHPVRSDDETLAYTVQTTTNLVSGIWTATGYSVNGTNVTGGTLNLVTNTMDSVEDEKFIRLLIEQN